MFLFDKNHYTRFNNFFFDKEQNRQLFCSSSSKLYGIIIGLFVKIVIIHFPTFKIQDFVCKTQSVKWHHYDSWNTWLKGFHSHLGRFSIVFGRTTSPLSWVETTTRLAQTQWSASLLRPFVYMHLLLLLLYYYYWSNNDISGHNKIFHHAFEVLYPL